MTRPLRAGAGRTRSDDKPYAVLDVETDGLRGALTYWTAGCEHGRRWTGRDADSLYRTILAHDRRAGCSGRDHCWWAHNGGEYDYLYLFDPARRDALAGRAVVSPLARSDRMIGLRITASKHRTDLRDSYALLPASLRALADQLAPELPKGDIGLGAGVVFDPDDPTHRDYAMRDSDALLAVMTRFRSIVGETWGVAPSWSAASTALRAWLATLPEGDGFWPAGDAADALSRAGYYGGIVHLRDIDWHDDVVTLDVNSMYPAVMRASGVPDGRPRLVRRFVPGRPGFYRITVTVPRDEPFTFLPRRDDHGRLSWPTGTFDTVTSSIELARAVERGYRLTVHAGVVWPHLAHPFGRFVDEIEALRRDGGAVGYVAKIMANSLYGKFGSRPLRDEWAISATPPGPGWWPLPGALDQPALDGLWRRQGVPLVAAYLLPHWAAWITAGARLALLGLCDSIGLANVLYTDTDSVSADRAAIEAAVAAGRVRLDPRSFGAAKVEHEYSRFRALAPKVTQGIERGEPVYRAKGIPRAQVAAAFDGGQVGWDSPTGALQVLRGAPAIVGRQRRISDIGHSHGWRLDGRRVIPVHAGTGEVDSDPST